MLGPHTVTILKPGGRDGWGDPITPGAEVTVPGCFWQPRSTTEQQNANNLVRVVAWVSMPPDTDITAQDRIRFEGREYAVQGRPELHHTPAGPHHYEVHLTDVEG